MTLQFHFTDPEHEIVKPASGDQARKEFKKIEESSNLAIKRIYEGTDEHGHSVMYVEYGRKSEVRTYGDRV